MTNTTPSSSSSKPAPTSTTPTIPSSSLNKPAPASTTSSITRGSILENMLRNPNYNYIEQYFLEERPNSGLPSSSTDINIINTFSNVAITTPSSPDSSDDTITPASPIDSEYTDVINLIKADSLLKAKGSVRIICDKDNNCEIQSTKPFNIGWDDITASACTQYNELKESDYYNATNTRELDLLTPSNLPTSPTFNLLQSGVVSTLSQPSATSFSEHGTLFALEQHRPSASRRESISFSNELLGISSPPNRSNTNSTSTYGSRRSMNQAQIQQQTEQLEEYCNAQNHQTPAILTRLGSPIEILTDIVRKLPVRERENLNHSLHREPVVGGIAPVSLASAISPPPIPNIAVTPANIVNLIRWGEDRRSTIAPVVLEETPPFTQEFNQ